MLLKKIIGILIIVLNVGGIGFILFNVGMILKDKYFSEKNAADEPVQASKDKEPAIKNDDIIPDEDDLLKDMDLSDLDNLNFDDFD